VIFGEIDLIGIFNFTGHRVLSSSFVSSVIYDSVLFYVANARQYKD